MYKEIEEAAEKYSMELLEAKTIQPHEKSWVESIFAQGAKKQTERMYSEEDLLGAFEAGMMFIGEDKGSFKEWFEQFKKK
jgi:hypothetical protein